MNLFKWANIFLCSSPDRRKAIVRACLKAIKIYVKGEPSKKGEKFYNFLKSGKVELIGVAPDLTYIKVDAKNKGDLEVLWNHKFSIPTLVYHVKGTPFLLLANANLEYNHSKLLEIEANKELEELRDIFGIMG